MTFFCGNCNCSYSHALITLTLCTNCREPLSDAEKAKGAAIYNTYVKLRWKRQRVMARDLQRKIKLKWAAIAALPTPELQREALEVNPMVPLRLRLATITPPLKGFQHEPFSSDKAAGAGADATSASGAAAAAAKSAAGDAAASATAAMAPKKRHVGGASAEAGVGSALSALRRRTSGASGPSLLSSLRGAAAAPGAAAASGVPSAAGSAPLPSSIPSSGIPSAGIAGLGAAKSKIPSSGVPSASAASPPPAGGAGATKQGGPTKQ